MIFQLIDASKADLPIERMSRLLDVSVSGYYAWKSRASSRRQLDDMI
jgi:putative transposase